MAARRRSRLGLRRLARHRAGGNAGRRTAGHAWHRRWRRTPRRLRVGSHTSWTRCRRGPHRRTSPWRRPAVGAGCRSAAAARAWARGPRATLTYRQHTHTRARTHRCSHESCGLARCLSFRQDSSGVTGGCCRRPARRPAAKGQGPPVSGTGQRLVRSAPPWRDARARMRSACFPPCRPAILYDKRTDAVRAPSESLQQRRLDTCRPEGPVRINPLGLTLSCPVRINPALLTCRLQDLPGSAGQVLGPQLLAGRRAAPGPNRRATCRPSWWSRSW